MLLSQWGTLGSVASLRLAEALWSCWLVPLFGVSWLQAYLWWPFPLIKLLWTCSQACRDRGFPRLLLVSGLLQWDSEPLKAWDGERASPPEWEAKGQRNSEKWSIAFCMPTSCQGYIASFSKTKVIDREVSTYMISPLSSLKNRISLIGWHDSFMHMDAVPLESKVIPGALKSDFKGTVSIHLHSRCSELTTVENFSQTFLGNTPGGQLHCSSYCIAMFTLRVHRDCRTQFHNPSDFQVHCVGTSKFGEGKGRAESKRWSDSLRKTEKMPTCHVLPPVKLRRWCNQAHRAGEKILTLARHSASKWQRQDLDSDHLGNGNWL
jgi:hypothetical protein